MKKIAGTVLVILGIMLFAHAVWWSPINVFVPHATKINNQIEIEDEDSIEMNITSENVTILPTDAEKVNVMVTGRDVNRINFTVNREHHKLKIDLSPKWYSFSNTNELKLLVSVPRKQVEQLEINASSKVVQIGNEQDKKWNIKQLNTNITDGTCYIKNMMVDNLVYNGTATDVMVDRVKAEQALINTFSGNINISHYIGALHVTSTSGNIRLQVDKLVGDVKTNMLSGNIDLFLPKSSSFSLKAKAPSGKLNVKYPLTNKKSSSTEVTGTSGSGKYKLEAEIMSGDVTIHE
jgi:lia operon protein LiaG